jgi:hypothetical protein
MIHANGEGAEAMPSRATGPGSEHARLASVVDAAIGASWVRAFDELGEAKSCVVDAHVAVLTAFAETISAAFESVQTETEPDVMVSGRLEGTFAPGGRDDGKLRFYLGRDVMATGAEDDRRLVANIRDLWLPRELQCQGYGRYLVATLMRLWRAIRIEEVRAHAVTDAGRAAFLRWGFTRGEEDYNGHTPFTFRLEPVVADPT